MSLLTALLLLAPGALPEPANPPSFPIGATITDFQLSDFAGKKHQLSDWQASKLVVVVFVNPECPVVKRYGPRLCELCGRYEPQGVAFVGIDANVGASAARMDEFVRASRLRMPILHDIDQSVADRLGARCNSEAFILDQARVVRYRGRIDDQYRPGVDRAQASRADLELGLTELLAGKPVSVPVTECAGCFIGRKQRSVSDQAITYSKHIAPIVQEHCVVCHRPGQIGPFALTSYKAAAAWSETIRAVIEDGRMPPWHANPKYGKFVNDRRLPDDDRQKLIRWIDAGAPEGNQADLPPPKAFPEDGWRIRKPDLVFSMPESFTIPAQGDVPYQYYEVDPGFTEDTWVQEAEIRPQNRAVVHHATVFLRPPYQLKDGKPTPFKKDELVMQGRLNSVHLVGYSAGLPPLVLPPGTAKKVPAHWRFVFQLHYRSTGTEQTDRARVGLVLADPKTVKRELATNMALYTELQIPAGKADQLVEASYHYPQDMLLYSLHPHMHLRGRSFRYEAQYPDGSRRILLDVPDYDFHWETIYTLAAPELLPAGTTVHCTAHYDNSANNPGNPDPNVIVRWGEQITDEMMIGYLDVAQADEDLTRPVPWTSRLLAFTRGDGLPFIALGSVLVCAVLLRFDPKRKARSSKAA
jgi:peroxiredoxin